VLSITDKSGYAVVAFIQDTLASALASKAPMSVIRSEPGTTLAHELRRGQPVPRNLELDFSPVLDLLKLPMLGGGPVLDAGTRSLDLNTVLATILDPSDTLRSILRSESPAEVFNRVKDFFHQRPALSKVLGALGSFVEGQFGIALSLITTFKNLLDPKFPQAIVDANLEYFFGVDGYVTVDEVHITPPMQLSGVPQQLSDLRTLFSERTGERFLRDLITVTVEAAGDVQYDLRDRFPQMASRLSAGQVDTAKRWFKGFSTMAESGVTAAVEETLLGVAQFQTNALIAASAGAFAGTMARKATQHVFLSELDL
jgi:hypothetical protein